MPTGLLVKDPNPGITPADRSIIRTDQWNNSVDEIAARPLMLLGRTILTVAGDVITVDNLPAVSYLEIRVYVKGVNGNIDANLRFNNDSGNNYAHRSSTNGAADVTTPSANAFRLRGGGTAGETWTVVQVVNPQANEKLCIADTISNSVSGAANAPSRVERVGKWVNTSVQISRADVVNLDAGDFDVGSEVVVLGIV